MSKITLLSIALASCSMGLLCTACKPGADESQEAKLHQVKVFPVLKQKVETKEKFFGYVKGADSTSLRPHIQGFIASQEYKDGSQVKKGDLLFRIEADLFEAQLNQSKANLEEAKASKSSAEASLAKAELDVKRYTELAAQGAVPEKTLLDAQEVLNAAKANIEQCTARIAQMQASVEKAQINLDYTQITAPYDGLMSTAKVSVGDLVDTSVELANIVSINPIDVSIAVNSATTLNNFNRGDGSTPVSAPPNFDIQLEDGSLYPSKGYVRNFDSYIDENGLISMNGRVVNDNVRLIPGLPVRTIIPMGDYEALLVPAEAIQSTLTNKFILALNKENIPSLFPVEIKGEFTIEVEEENGYKSEQKMISVAGIGQDLESALKALGYDSIEQVPIVSDALNGMYAASISAANSRMPEDSTEPKGKIDPLPFTFKPALSVVGQKISQAKERLNDAPKTDVTATLPPIPVKVLNFVQEDIELTEEWQGYLRGVEETAIRPQISGFLLSQDFADGSPVKKDDVLFRIDPAPFQAALDEAEANLSAAVAAEKMAQALYNKNSKDVEIYQKLKTSSPGAVSDKTLTDAITEKETSAATLQEAQAAILQMQAMRDTAKINLGYTVIKAPFSGLSSLSNPSTGQLLSPNDALPLVNLSSINPIRVDFGVNGRTALQALTREVSKGKGNGGVKDFQSKKFSIVLENGKSYPHEGQFISADNVVDTDTGTISVVGHIPNDEDILRSGMPVRVRTVSETIHKAVLVPARAPIDSQGKSFLILVNEDQSPRLLPITRGVTTVIPVKDAEGNNTPQPMQVVDVDRELATAILLHKNEAENIEDIIFTEKKVKNWSELALQIMEGSDFRQLTEKLAGKALPDDTPKQNRAKDWEELYMHRHGVGTAKEFVLMHEEASDDIGYLSKIQGFDSAIDLVLDFMGFKDLTQIPLVVEGSMSAMRTIEANEKSQSSANKLNASPFIYNIPTTVVPSVTAPTSTSSANN